MNQRLWVVCYDIRDERRLRRVARAMERYGVRRQKSVFECWLDPNTLDRMRSDTAKEMDPAHDSLRLYAVCRDCQALSLKDGGTTIEAPATYYIV